MKKNTPAPPEPLTVSLLAEAGFTVLTRPQVECVMSLLQSIIHPRLDARQLPRNKGTAYEEALARGAQTASEIWSILCDANMIPAPSPGYGIETPQQKMLAEEARKSCTVNNSLHSAYYAAKREAEKAAKDSTTTKP